MLGPPKLDTKSLNLSFDTHIVSLWSMICPQTPKYIANRPMQHCAPLRGQFLYPERGQKQTFFDPLPPHLVHVVIDY